MASRDLLELLGSGAAFSGKRHGKEAGRAKLEVPVDSTINFFAPATAASEKKRRRELDGHQIVPPTRDSCSGKPPLTTRNFSKKSSHSGVRLFPARASPEIAYRSSDDSMGSPLVGDARASQIHTEEIACFRRRMGIRVKGENIADPMQTFLDMPQPGSNADAVQTRRALLNNVEESQWKEPTAVQMQAVPILLAGRDLLAAAPTGSGKTAAFVMPMILRLAAQAEGDTRGNGVRGVLLAPTRELAAQIHRDVVRLSRGRKIRACLLTKAGTVKTAAAAGVHSKNALSGYDIVVTTPMRIVALLREGVVSLANVKMVVLDEADKLFETDIAGGGSDKAFVGQVDEVLAACSHRDVQRALFSATIGHHVRTVTAGRFRFR